MPPHDQKIGIKGDNPQLFLIIPSEILKVVHQEILNIFVNLKLTQNLRNWFDHAIKHKPYFCWTTNLVKYSQLGYSRLVLCHWILPPTSEEYWLFTFSFQQLLSHRLLFLLFCTLANFAHFFSPFLLFILAPIRLQITSGHPSTVIFWRGIKEQQAATPLYVLFLLFTLIYLLII